MVAVSDLSLAAAHRLTAPATAEARCILRYTYTEENLLHVRFQERESLRWGNAAHGGLDLRDD